MASSAISTPTTYPLCSSTPNKKPIFSISSSLTLQPQTSIFHLSTSIPLHGTILLSPWNGLKQLGLPIKHKFTKTERRGRSKGKGVYASLFGVGAPEALVIGVVALLVFGPKGLAEVARNLGKTLRAFQPTIRELQDVSREFKSTLEREIGLDDIPPSSQKSTGSTIPTTSPPSANNENSQTTADQNGTPLTKKPYSTEEYLNRTEEQLGAMVVQSTPPERPENELQFQDGETPMQKPFNIGELLVEAQIKSTAAQMQEQAVPQEAQSEIESPTKEIAPTVSPPPTNPESDK